MQSIKIVINNSIQFFLKINQKNGKKNEIEKEKGREITDELEEMMEEEEGDR